MIYKRFCNALIVIARQIIKIKTEGSLIMELHNSVRKTTVKKC